MRQASVVLDQERLWGLLRYWGTAVIICGLFFAVDRIEKLNWFKGGVERGFILIDSKISRVIMPVSHPAKIIKDFTSRSERIADLEDRLARTALDQQALQELKTKVIALEAMVARIPSGQKAERITQLVNYSDQLMVVGGEHEGVKTGQVITDQEGSLVGRIRQTGKYLSEVERIGDPETKVTVQTTNGSTKGVLEGKGNQARISGVLQSESLMVNDILVTNGADGVYPPGLLVGQVILLTGKPEDVTKGGVVELFVTDEGWVALW